MPTFTKVTLIKLLKKIHKLFGTLHWGSKEARKEIWSRRKHSVYCSCLPRFEPVATPPVPSEHGPVEQVLAVVSLVVQGNWGVWLVQKQ